MFARFALLGCAVAAMIAGWGFSLHAQTPIAPGYTADGKLVFPTDYRSWVFLSSGMDMSYLATPRAGMSTFGNVFVNRESYDAFQKTGAWPDKTMLVLEIREASQNGSINRNGHFQTGIVHSEVHVKDSARGGWAFYGFGDGKPATMIPRSADCYSCHQDHGAVDTTFVQFYPTLLPLAREKQTLSQGYLKDEASVPPP
jgi:cytochrome P460